MNETNNPFQPPQADLNPPPIPVQAQNLLTEPRAVPIGAAMTWLKEGLVLLKKDLGIWILLALALFIIQVVIGMIPVIGDVVGTVLYSVFAAGLFMGIQQSANGGKLDFNYLIAAFKDKNKLLSLLGLGAISVVIMFVLMMIMGMVFYAANPILANSATMSPEQMVDVLVNGKNFTLFLLGTLLFLFISLLFWFATPLIALHNMPLLQAVQLSIKGALRNILPLIVYSILLTVLFLIGILPFLLGLLLVIPWFFCSWYAAYRQIYLA